MTLWMQVAALFAGLNVLLLVALTGVWLTNFRRFRTAMTLGFLSFGVVLLIENLIALYVFFALPQFDTIATVTQQVTALLRVLEFVALTCLSWVIVR